MNANHTAEMAWELRHNMMRVALGILQQNANAEDAVSEALFKAYQNAHTLREERYFKTWIMRILVRCCYDMLRKHKREVLVEDFSVYDKPALENQEGSVFELLQALPLHYRDVLILHYYEGFKAKEIAHVLGLPTPTVLVRLARGRDRLRLLLEKEEAFYAEQSI